MLSFINNLNFTHSFVKKIIFASTFAFLASFLACAPEVKSQSRSACGDVSGLSDVAFAQQNQGGCGITPEKYEIVLYEMGLCTGDSSPISGGSLSRTNCTATFSNVSGQTVDLAGSASITLSKASSQAPAPNTYTWGYVVMANTFGLKGSIETASNTWRSSSDSTASSTSTSNVEFTESLTTFSGSSGTCLSSGSASTNLGEMSAILAGSDLTEDTSCSNVSRLVGVFSPTSSYAISSSTSALKITFDVATNTSEGYIGALTVMPSNTGGVASFGSGPFRMEITTIE